MEPTDCGYLICVGVIFGVIFGVLIGGWINDWGGVLDIKELGQAICEEEYDMEYVSYSKGKLTCKPILEDYDGLQVELRKLE